MFEAKLHPGSTKEQNRVNIAFFTDSARQSIFKMAASQDAMTTAIKKTLLCKITGVKIKRDYSCKSSMRVNVSIIEQNIFFSS